jgi:hypothetical protein
MQLSATCDNLCSAPAGPPNPEDDRNHDLDPRGADNDLKEVVSKLISDSIGKAVEKAYLLILLMV